MTQRTAAASLLVVLAAVTPAAASDPIDRTLDECLGTAEGSTTMGQVTCLSQAYDAWDRELNVAYGALMEKLDAPSGALLRDAQRRWLAYRDADRAFEGGPWAQDQGTMMHVILNSAAVDRVRARTQALRSYLDAYE